MTHTIFPNFTINTNRLLGAIAALSSGLIAYFVVDENLRTMLSVFVTGAIGSVSVKAQTINPDSTEIIKGEKSNESLDEKTS